MARQEGEEEVGTKVQALRIAQVERSRPGSTLTTSRVSLFVDVSWVGDVMASAALRPLR